MLESVEVSCQLVGSDECRRMVVNESKLTRFYTHSKTMAAKVAMG